MVGFVGVNGETGLVASLFLVEVGDGTDCTCCCVSGGI